MRDEVSEKNVNLEFIISEKRVKSFVECGSRGGSKRGESRPFGFKE